MTDKYESNGDYYADNFKRKSSDIKDDVGDPSVIHSGDSEEANAQNQKANEYVKELLAEKIQMDHHKLPHSVRLVDQEVTKTQQNGRIPQRDYKFVDIYREKPIKVTVKVLVPVREHPKFNFVGKLLGPKGNSMKRLQEETMCKMAVLGRGSMRDRQKEDELRNSLDPKYSHLMEDLHVEISALGPPAEAHARVAFALAEVRKYLIPDSNDNIRQEQMREMEIMVSESTHSEDRERERSARKSVSLLRSASIARAPPPPIAPRTVSRLPPITTRPVMPAKTKILSILDRARIAMEESYGYDDRERYAPSPPPYEYPRYVDRYEDYDMDYYPRGSSSSYAGAEPPSRSWKAAFKPSSSSSSMRHSESSRYRTSPYTRPSK